jgi:hypothetical protein
MRFDEILENQNSLNGINIDYSKLEKILTNNQI